jgi:hypothetical protein
MIMTNGHPAFRTWILAPACLVVAGALFGLGYWQGHRALTSQRINPGYGNNPARFSAAAAVSHPAIPANASPEMKEFLQNQATLADKMELLRSQGPNGTLNPQMFVQFRQQNADLLARQSQLAQIIAQQQAKNTLSAPPPLQIPPNASPKLQTYLKLRDQIMRDQIAFMNQHKTDDLASRQAAMQKWRQENATRLQQLQQLTQALSPTATTK